MGFMNWLSGRGEVSEGGDDIESYAEDINMTTIQPVATDRWGIFDMFHTSHKRGEGGDTTANQPGETYRETGNHGHKGENGVHYKK